RSDQTISNLVIPCGLDRVCVKELADAAGTPSPVLSRRPGTRAATSDFPRNHLPTARSPTRANTSRSYVTIDFSSGNLTKNQATGVVANQATRTVAAIRALAAWASERITHRIAATAHNRTSSTAAGYI